MVVIFIIATIMPFFFSVIWRKKQRITKYKLLNLYSNLLQAKLLETIIL